MLTSFFIDKNRSKIDFKSSQNRSHGRPGSVLAHLGRVLGASWTRLGPSWRHLGQSWRHLAPSWRYLGPSWAHLSLPNLPKTFPRSVQEASKTPPKTRSNIDPILGEFETKKPFKTNEKTIKKHLSWQVNGKRV